jgi:hypothetical protein
VISGARPPIALRATWKRYVTLLAAAALCEGLSAVTPRTFSHVTIKAMAEVISGGSANDPTPPIGIYRSGPKLEELMRDCHLDFRVGNGSRVASLLQFLRDVAAQPDGGQQMARIILRVAEPYDYRQCPDKVQAVVEHLNQWLVADGYEVVLINGKPRLRTRGSSGTVIDSFAAKATAVDFDTVSRELERALESADNDPEDAVTAACSTLEAVCRSILRELGLELPAKKDIDGLVRAVQEPLGLSPGRTDLPAEIASDIRQILGGLTTAAKGIGALRTHAGDAHGRERGFKRIDARIARLAIHAASTLALFLIETWEKKVQTIAVQR